MERTLKEVKWNKLIMISIHDCNIHVLYFRLTEPNGERYSLRLEVSSLCDANAASK